MKLITMIVVGLFLVSPPTALSEDKEAAVRAVIRAFYSAFDDGFVGPADYATEDWNHINPYGGRVGGREATLKGIREVHQSFLKGTTDTIESMDIRFATEDVAVGTVTSVMSPFTSPDGVKHGKERHIRTFIVVAWRKVADNAGPQHNNYRPPIMTKQLQHFRTCEWMLTFRMVDCQPGSYFFSNIPMPIQPPARGSEFSPYRCSRSIGLVKSVTRMCCASMGCCRSSALYISHATRR
jgi:ketosteroid isomerase-like protein